MPPSRLLDKPPAEMAAAEDVTMELLAKLAVVWELKAW